MKRAWRVIFLVMLMALVVGAICIGVGILTGAEYSRIYTVIDNRFHIQMWIDYVKEVYASVMTALTAA